MFILVCITIPEVFIICVFALNYLARPSITLGKNQFQLLCHLLPKWLKAEENEAELLDF